MELTLVFVGLLIIGIALIFRGNESWKVIFTAAGLYLGGYFTYNVVEFLGFTAIPIYITVAVGAILGALILTFLVRIGLSLGFGYLVYLIAIILFQLQFYYAVLAALIGFAVAYALYKEFVHVVAGVVGAFAAYYALLRLGFPILPAQITAAAMYVVGVSVEEWEKRRKKRLGKVVREQKAELKAEAAKHN